MNFKDYPLLVEASQFAHEAHDSIQQVRKYTGEPYWVHTDEVGILGLDSYGPSPTQEQIEAVAGYFLHDYREDVVPELLIRGQYDLLNAFEARFNALPELTKQVVDELTDKFTKENYPQLSRAQRKAKEVERLATISDFGKNGKCADFISNTATIVEHDPKFAKTYLREKEQAIRVLGGAQFFLYKRAIEQLQDELKKLALV